MTILYIIVGLIAAYLTIGYLFHYLIFPETRPNPAGYFDRGDEFESEAGGNKIKVLNYENGYLRLELTFDPNSAGPPVHIQTGWDESYKVISGELTLIQDGEEKKLGPGDEITIPRGVPHKPENRTDEPVVSVVLMPAQFVLYLSQIYGFMDEDEKNARPPRMILQMAVTNQYFDSYLGEGPPVFVQKTLNFLLIPLARIMGYKSFYEKYRI